jgi:hypothetical protein
MADNRKSSLLFIFTIFLFLITYPILGIFDHHTMTFGMPTLFFYLFFVWLALIIAVGLVVKNKR